MPRAAAPALIPRKTPRQARSVVTLEAIHTATIQVLLRDGVTHLTTTKVAERAGVSVGTLYQYYPHKEALLFAMVRLQMARIRSAMEEVAVDLAGLSLSEISDGLVSAWLTIKTEDIAGSRAVYGVAADFDIAEITRESADGLIEAVQSVLVSACDCVIAHPRAATFTLLTVMGGAVRTVLERGAPEAELALLRAELPIVCREYLRFSAQPDRDSDGADGPLKLV